MRSSWFSAIFFSTSTVANGEPASSNVVMPLESDSSIASVIGAMQYPPRARPRVRLDLR